MDAYVLMIGLAVGLVIAAITDIRFARIPNWLTFSLVGFGMTVHTIHDGWDGLVFSLEGLGLGIICLLFFYIKGGMGAGDVKLLGAIGAIIGPVHIIPAFLMTAILGGLYSFGMMMTLGGLRHSWERVLVLLTTLRLTKKMPDSGLGGEPKLRYALVIGLGTIMAEIWAWTG